MRLIKSDEGLQAFWAELKPCDHLVQIYEAEDEFLELLHQYVHGGLLAGECVLLIATPAHLEALERRLETAGIDLPAERQADRYIALDAEEVLARFMVNGWPDADRFREVVRGLLTRGTAKGARVRAFGEMVALLWGRKLYAATVQLEHLWQRFCHAERFALLCAYPVSGPTSSLGRSMREICAAHSHVITKHGLAPA